VFRNKNNQQPGPSRPIERSSSDARADQLAARLDAAPRTPRLPILTEAEALVVVDLLEQLTEQPVSDQLAQDREAERCISPSTSQTSTGKLGISFGPAWFAATLIRPPWR
jgi:hypothetical protein